MKNRCITAAISFILLISCIPANSAYAAEYPEKYRTEEVTEVKNQDSTNLCWAFASASVMETELMKNNNVSKEIDLSELQIAYFSMNPAMDPLGQHTRLFSGSNDFNEGYSAGALAGILAAGLSPVTESAVEVSLDDASIATKLDSSLAYGDTYYLKECKNLRFASRDEIKSVIMQYGSVVIDYNADTNYYNTETFGWYNPNKDYTNHAACVVGWDDTYSKKNFLQTPEGDGAWIVKNSWGESFGDQGYFYLSYYDQPLQESDFIAFDMELGAYSDNLYQNVFSVETGKSIDMAGNANWGNGFRHDNTVSKIANLFTAQANDSGGETLKAISVFTQSEANYEIKIYKNIKENANPESGILAATLSGSFSVPGFKIIPLKKSLYLSEGESFSIVVNFTDENGKHVGVARGDGEVTLATLGQSLMYETYPGEKEGHWVDCAYRIGQNFFINAYTDNVEKNKEADSKKVTMELNLTYPAPYDYAEDVKELEVSYTDSNSVILSWSKTPHKYYVIYKYNSVAGTWQKVGYSDKAYYTVTGLKAGNGYTFGVKAIAQAPGVSSKWMPYYESINFAKTDTKTSTSEKVVPSLTVTEEGNVLIWEKLSDATAYSIYVQSPFTDYEWILLKKLSSADELRYIDSSVVGGITYTYRIYAYEKDKLISKGIPVSGLVE